MTDKKQLPFFRVHDEKLHRRVKVLAAEKDMTMTEVVENALIYYMKNKFKIVVDQ